MEAIYGMGGGGEKRSGTSTPPSGYSYPSSAKSQEDSSPVPGACLSATNSPGSVPHSSLGSLHSSSRESVPSILAFANRNPVLLELDPSHSRGLGDEGAAQLVQGLFPSQLERLILCNCRVGVQTATAMSRVLEQNLTSLRQVDLSVNHHNLSVEALQTLRQSMARNTQLEQLDLELCFYPHEDDQHEEEAVVAELLAQVLHYGRANEVLRQLERAPLSLLPPALWPEILETLAAGHAAALNQALQRSTDLDQLLSY